MSIREWTPEEKVAANRMRDEGKTYPEIGVALDRPRNSVNKFFQRQREGGNQPIVTPASARTVAPSLPAPAPEAGGPSLPEPADCSYAPFTIDSGRWGVISDIHIPFHSLETLNAWVDDCKRMAVDGIFLNGDVLDCYQVSDHKRDPSKPGMKDEISKGRQFIEYLRATFPRARIIYKAGNHDERLLWYLATRAPEVFDLEDIQLQNLLRLSTHGVEWLADKRIAMLGRLAVIHGHEYRGGGGVMPARWLFLRTGESAMCGHFHHPTNYTFRTITGKEVGMWSTGCACHLSPLYAPLNQWGNGWAMVEISAGGLYHVHNRRRLISGQVV